MDKVIRVWKDSLFTDPILFAILILTFAVSLKKGKSHPQLKILPYYLASFILFSLISEVILSQEGNVKNLSHIRFEHVGNFLVTCLEFFSFAYYAYKITSNHLFKKIINAISIAALLSSTILILAYYDNLEIITYSTLNFIYILESVFLLIVSSFYFVDLFSSSSIAKLFTTTNFWVSSGLTFYVFCTLPFTVLSDYFIQTNGILYKNLYALIYIFYILLFLMIIKGYYAKG